MKIADLVFSAIGCAIAIVNFIILITNKIYVWKKNKAFHYICSYYEKNLSAASISKIKEYSRILNCQIESIISDLLREGKIMSTAETDQPFLDIQVYPINYRKLTNKKAPK